jgi:CheY-like chemotaxis protein
MSHTLLLADASVTIQRVIELTFSDEDVRVVAVGDGQQAIDRLSADPPDIVLADIGMSKRNGYDVAAFVKGQPALAGIPVLLLTGAFEKLDDAQVKASGADGVLVKPFEPSAVIGRVKELLGLGPGKPPAPPQSTRLVTEAGAPARPAPAPETTLPVSAAPPAAPANWNDLREETGLGPEAPSVESGGTDGYFDSLDAAFDHLDARLSGSETPEAMPRTVAPAPEVPPASAGPARPVAPVASGDVASEAPPPAVASAPEPVVPAPIAFASPPSMADAFAALLEAEQGQRVGPLEITEELVDRVAERVAAKLVAGQFTDEVRTIARETAERLVREEILRVRGVAERRR